MPWNPTVFANHTDGSTGVDCTIWANVSRFDDWYPTSDFQWDEIWANNYINCWHNNGAAIKLLITRCNYLESLITGSSVTMDSILNAMLSATFKQLTSFMGLLEAYKLAVWNAPFNAEYYAALARGFVKWQ